MQCRLRDRRSRLFSLGLRPCPLRTEIPPDSLNLLIMLCTVEGEISKSLPIFLWGTLFLNISIIFSRICWQTGDPRPIFAPKGLDLSWMLLLYQIIITITCWHQLFQITSLFNQFTSLLALNCSCPNFFWNVLQVWMTGKDVYLQMTWSWPDKTWNILCSYCLQWNTSQSKFRNHYFLFLFAFSILSQLFLIWGCNKNSNWSHSILFPTEYTISFWNFVYHYGIELLWMLFHVDLQSEKSPGGSATVMWAVLMQSSPVLPSWPPDYQRGAGLTWGWAEVIQSWQTTHDKLVYLSTEGAARRHISSVKVSLQSYQRGAAKKFCRLSRESPKGEMRLYGGEELKFDQRKQTHCRQTQRPLRLSRRRMQIKDAFRVCIHLYV